MFIGRSMFKPAIHSLVSPATALGGADADLLSSDLRLAGRVASGFPQRAGREEDFLSQEVEKTELLRTADGHHACLQLLLEEGVPGGRFGEVQVPDVREMCLILDHPVLLA